MISWDEFSKVDMRAGTILRAEAFPQAKKASYKLTIDFGELGILQSSAQITDLYSLEELAGMQVVAVVNLGKKQIATFISECLVLGVYDKEDKVVLLKPSRDVDNGCKIG